MYSDDFLLACLNVAWAFDTDVGMYMWLAAFQAALDNWRQDLCRLLQEIKHTSLAPEFEALVRYVEGRLAEQWGN